MLVNREIDRYPALGQFRHRPVLLKAFVLETRVKLMLRGDDHMVHIHKAIFMRTSVCSDSGNSR
jgi:hypothetical protein